MKSGLDRGLQRDCALLGASGARPARGGRVAQWAVLGLCATLGAGRAFAQTEVYFSEYQFQLPRISAMGLDGSNPHLLFLPSSSQWLPLGMSFRASTQRLIWMDSAGASEIMSANIDGSGQVMIATPPGFCRGISLDALGRIYFGSGNTVKRVNADGTGMITIFTAATSNPVGCPRVDATNAHVYIGADGEIKRMDLDGSNLKTVVRGISQPRAIGLNIAAGHIYWLDADTISDYIGRARLDGTGFTVLHDVSPNVVQSPGLIDLLVDPASGFVFYADELSEKIVRMGLSGQNAMTIFTSLGGASPSGLTLSTGEPVQVLQDCDGNGIGDDVDIAAGAPDCDNNGVPDTCQVKPCMARVFLLDQGSDAANSTGRAVGVPSQWQVFQPFDVPAGGWSIGEIAMDGLTSNYADGSGLTVRLYPDDGTGTRPNEATELGSTTLGLLFNTNFVNWVYTPLRITLGPGRYWARVEANNPTVYGGSINHGFSGLNSLSRGSSGNFTNPAPPVALRLVEAMCLADYNGDSFVDGIDYDVFFNHFEVGDERADINGDGFVDGIDADTFNNAFEAGC